MRRSIIGLFILILTAIVGSGCAPASKQSIIYLSSLHPLPVPPASDTIPLRISVAAVISPQGTVESYQPLLDYLSAALDRPVELVQRRTYAETNDLVESGEVDLAFVCTSAYITGHDNFDMHLLVAPEVKGSTTYHSLLIVPIDSPAQTMSDLRGKVFAFTDPISNTGRVYPTYLVEQLGFTPETFFARTFFTYNHDDAIRAVADKLADGAAVDSLVYEYALERDSALSEQVRIIYKSPSFGIPPVVVSPNIRPQTQAILQEILLDMNKNVEGQAALASLGIDAFIPIDDSAYDSARELIGDVGILSP